MLAQTAQLAWYMQAQYTWVAVKRAAKAGSTPYATLMARHYVYCMQQAGLNG